MEQKTKELLRGVRHVALDMDGTIYMGSNLFPKEVVAAQDWAWITAKCEEAFAYIKEARG